MKPKKAQQAAKIISLIRVNMINGTGVFKGTCLQFLMNNPVYQNAFGPVTA